VSVVVLGAGGLLGRAIVDAVDGQQVRALARAECDITDERALAAATADAHLIVNCAAFTNVDGAEANEDAAWRVNALGAEAVARVAARHGSALVHVSTDFVFDGAQPQPYDEFATPNPQSIYARSKRAGEELARAAYGRLFVVRVQGLYGDGGANFSSKLRQLLIAGKPLRLDGERRVQPTSARAAAAQIVALAATDWYGTYHVSCTGETTWAGFAARLAERLELPRSWDVVRTAELAAPARRPPNCLFEHRMLRLRGLMRMPSWEEAQDEYLRREASR
jgi:dTDP-4-dehydrorhamnose reductase